ncbi:hypothetical protein SNE40_018303 [Patella caerulea]|uniref:Uncharacterized protein n=1 Tax=Patella caerulea TaxID=87958 RepID=A0AAN8JA71_PATCE
MQPSKRSQRLGGKHVNVMSRIANSKPSPTKLVRQPSSLSHRPNKRPRQISVPTTSRLTPVPSISQLPSTVSSQQVPTDNCLTTDSSQLPPVSNRSSTAASVHTQIQEVPATSMQTSAPSTSHLTSTASSHQVPNDNCLTTDSSQLPPVGNTLCSAASVYTQIQGAITNAFPVITQAVLASINSTSRSSQPPPIPLQDEGMSSTHPTVQTNLLNDKAGTNATAQPLSFVADPKIKGKIWANKYIEMFQLLVAKASKCRFLVSETSDNKFLLCKEEAPPKLHGFTQWLKAFHVFVSIYAEKFPTETPHLMKYISAIRELASQAARLQRWTMTRNSVFGASPH